MGGWASLPANSHGTLWKNSRDHQLQNPTSNSHFVDYQYHFCPSVSPKSSYQLWQQQLGFILGKLQQLGFILGKLRHLGALCLHCSFAEGGRPDVGVPCLSIRAAPDHICLLCHHCCLEEGRSGIFKTRKLRRPSCNHVAESKPELRSSLLILASSFCLFVFFSQGHVWVE